MNFYTDYQAAYQNPVPYYDTVLTGQPQPSPPFHNNPTYNYYEQPPQPQPLPPPPDVRIRQPTNYPPPDPVMVSYSIKKLYNNLEMYTLDSVSPRINIKGGGVHQWYMTFGQYCSISVMFFSINFRIKGWGSNTKGWGSAMLPSFRGNTA